MPPPPPVELILERLRTVVLPAESGAGKRGPLSELFLGRAETKFTKCSQNESLFFKYILDQNIINKRSHSFLSSIQMVWPSGIQIAFKYWTIWCWLFKYYY